MIEELNATITSYKAKWEVLIGEREDRRFFATLRPTAVAWKTVDQKEYDKILLELHELSDIVGLAPKTRLGLITWISTAQRWPVPTRSLPASQILTGATKPAA